jgi:hypothetical protein
MIFLQEADRAEMQPNQPGELKQQVPHGQG